MKGKKYVENVVGKEIRMKKKEEEVKRNKFNVMLKC